MSAPAPQGSTLLLSSIESDIPAKGPLDQSHPGPNASTKADGTIHNEMGHCGVDTPHLLHPLSENSPSKGNISDMGNPLKSTLDSETAIEHQEVPKSHEGDVSYANDLGGGGTKASQGTFADDGSSLGRELLKRLCDSLYVDGYTGTPSHYHGIDVNLAASQTPEQSAAHLVQNIIFLVSFLEQNKSERSIADFLNAIRQTTEWNFLDDTEFSQAWKTLWHAIGFVGEIEIKAATFQGQMHSLFKPTPHGRATSFTISLADLERVDLTVIPTHAIHEHLTLHNNRLKVLSFDYHQMTILLQFQKNRVAKKLGIETIGEEILASLYGLYGKDQLYRKAEILDIFCPESYYPSDALRSALRTMLVSRKGVAPKVLMDRLLVLENTIKYRRSWWQTLWRDIKKQTQSQPFVLYGAILAVFFGVCTFVQTVASVWALVLAIRASKC